MTPERWGKIESIFHKALEADESRRGSVIEESCAGDETLRREVESLLAHHSESASFIEQPAFADQVDTFTFRPVTAAAAPRPDLKGIAVGHYRILEEIGTGGMGVVYKAEDTRLGRLVALKFLPEHMAADSVALERFRREARAASSLNHPNICTIHDIDVYEDREFIVMEYLDGQTLARYMAGRRAVDTQLVAKLGMPIAEALGAAHSRGVIHRDIKPGNIFVTQSGLVKVLDFGVAKLVAGADQSEVTTLTETHTITGTLPYMSPEQLRGEKVDTRSDIYALGVVLYEIATGQRLYSSSLHAQLVDEILNRPASPPSSINKKLSAKADEIILKCLAKDPEDRYQTAKEIAVDLRHLSTQATSGAVSADTSSVRTGSRFWPRRRSEFSRKQAAILAVGSGLRWWPVAVVALLAIAYLLRPTLPPPTVTGTAQLTHDNAPKTWQYLLLPLLSDGLRLYFYEPTSRPILYQVSIEGGDSELARLPNPSFWLAGVSPTRPEWLLGRDGGSLWTLTVPGGQPHRIGNLTADDAMWSPDGSKLYYSAKGSIYSAAPDGSDAHQLLTVKGDPDWMRFSPDGRVLRFTVAADPSHPTSSLSLWEAQSDGSHLHQLLPGFTNPASDCCGSWTPDGNYFVFQATRDGTPALWAIREGGDWWHKVNHAPVRLTQGVMGAYSPLAGKDNKIYFAGVMPRGELTHYDPKIRSLSPFLGGISASGLNFSKDGKHLAFMSYPDYVLRYCNSDGSGLRQLTFPPMQAGAPRISPDGSQIAFTAEMPGQPAQVHVIPVDGGDPEAITSGSQESWDPTWSPSGDALLYGPYFDATNGSTALHIVNLKTRVVTAVPGSGGLYSPRWSPDGRYLLALTPNPQRLKFYDLNLHTWQDLTGDIGVGYPEWTPDSKCIVFSCDKGTALWENRVCLADRKIEPIADLSASGKLVNDYGSWSWTGLAPDGSILALRDISTQEIYALDVKWP